MLLLLHIRSRLRHTNFFTLRMRKGGGGITVFLLRNTVYPPPPPSISVFLSLWEGGRSDGTLRYMHIHVQHKQL